MVLVNLMAVPQNMIEPQEPIATSSSTCSYSFAPLCFVERASDVAVSLARSRLPVASYKPFREATGVTRSIVASITFCEQRAGASSVQKTYVRPSCDPDRPLISFEPQNQRRRVRRHHGASYPRRLDFTQQRHHSRLLPCLRKR